MKRNYFKFIIVVGGILLSSTNVYALDNNDKNISKAIVAESNTSNVVVDNITSANENLESETKEETIAEGKAIEKTEVSAAGETAENNDADTKIDTDRENVETDKDDAKEKEEVVNSGTSTEGDEQEQVQEEEEDNDNTSIDKAKFLEVNNMDESKMSKESEIRWYMTYSSKGKVTAYLVYNADTEMKLNLHLFKVDLETEEIQEVSNSSYSNGGFEQLSYIGDEGYYFVAVNSVSGFNENNAFAIALTYADSYDSFEANDNINNCTIIPEKEDRINGTIDNIFDADWYEVTVSENKPSYISLDNSNSDVLYTLQVYDSNYNLLTTLNQNQYITATLPAGKYYLKAASSSGSDAESPYSIRFIMYDDLSTAKAITSLPMNIHDSIDNELDCNWNYFKINSDITFNGVIKNNSDKCECKVELFKVTDDGNLELVCTLNQNYSKIFDLSAGLYYMKTSAVEGFDSNTQYNIQISQYVYEPSISFNTNELYVNGSKVELRYIYDWRSTTSRARTNIDYDANQYCTIRSAVYIGSGYSGVEHGILVTVDHCLYSNWQTIWDGEYWRTPYESAYIDGIMFVVDADTGKCVIASRGDY